MNLAEVMDEIAARLDTLAGLRVHAYPPPVVHPPAAVVTYPEEYTYDTTYGRGSDTMTIPVVVLVGKVDDRSSRNQLAAWVDSAGVRRYDVTDVDQLTKYTITADSPNVSGVEIAGGNLDFELTAGNDVGGSNLRDIYIRNGLTATDFHARATFDPPFYGALTSPTVTVNPQHGLMLRYQRDATKQRGVSLWQNIFFLVPLLNVGVWTANLDGTGFVARNAEGWPLPVGLAFPYTVEARLTGNVVEVRQWEVGDEPPRWGDPVLSRTINLDTQAGDAGATPTPVGEGSAGLIVAHLGTEDRSICRYPLADLYFEENAASIKATLEAAPAYNAFRAVRVVDVEFDVIAIAQVEHVAATFKLEITGNGAN